MKEKKIDIFHYHELVHACSMITEDVENHLLNHNLGNKYKDQINAVIKELTVLYSDITIDYEKKRDKIILVKNESSGNLSNTYFATPYDTGKRRDTR